MKTIKRPSNDYDHYHAHVYFDDATAAQAETLCRGAGERFGVLVGRFHHKLVGPHPYWSCQLTFDRSHFQALIPWLEQNRGGLDILVHGLSGDGYADHTDHASWLGNPAHLHLEFFSRPATRG